MTHLRPANHAQPGHPDLFRESNCETHCALYEACGGSSTAPCGCVWRDPEKRHNCEDCHLICRERDSSSDSFHHHIGDHRSLNDIRLRQLQVTFPGLIPARTRELKASCLLSSDWKWVGVSLKHLLRESETGAVSSLLKKTPAEFRKALCIPRSTKVVAVLNGTDPQLEGFWGMQRETFYECVSALGFDAVTGPTFSITSEYKGDPITPASHNVIMLQRHHQVMGELAQSTDALVIPNVYWRNKSDREKWACWLNETKGVNVIARDFSVTKDTARFRPELDGLLQILEWTNRPMHVLLCGIGISKASSTLQRLADYGCTGSVVMGEPITAAVLAGERIEMRGHTLARFRDPNTGRLQLAYSNLQVVRQYLARSSSSWANRFAPEELSKKRRHSRGRISHGNLDASPSSSQIETD